MLTVPNYYQRLRVMLYKAEFREKIKDLIPVSTKQSPG